MKKVSVMLNSTHLSKFTEKIQTEYSGKLYGKLQQLFVSMPVRFAYPSCSTLINVIFKIDIAAQYSSLTGETFQKLKEICPKFNKVFNDV